MIKNNHNEMLPNDNNNSTHAEIKNMITCQWFVDFYTKQINKTLVAS
jgi:hypothetical protein